MRLFFSPRAARRLREIQAYLAFAASLNTALRVVLRIRQSAEMLTDFPRLGVEWEGGPTRTLRVSGLPYSIHYRLHAEAVEIITIHHHRQKPPRFG
ncbi:type II toxin-antitoxin system RelE/ParE family toxin [Cereibacter sediminicola]|uniref:type II toxin-antitoxin system RelE/ParE family toxin n=1 Tax=Cereibacter sediminicola TaxID=2584941 RepID=UPI0011A816B0|nr:type II toxin-antitoxin system RelE/ParE family toxin [Cereibacter sediminicola]